MKIAFCIGVAAALSFSAPAAMAADECSRIVSTGHPEYPAMAFKDGDRIRGAAPSLVKAIASGLDVPLEAQYMGSWAEAQAATRKGDADMIFGIYYNDERAEFLDYVQPGFAYDPVNVFVVQDKPFDYKDQSDLIGKKGATNKGESYGTEFDAFMADKLDVVRTDGIDKAFEALLAGEADYVIAGYYPGQAEATRLDINDQVVPLEPPVVSDEMFIAFSKKSPCAALAAKFGDGVETLTTDGSFEQMMRDAMAQWAGDETP
jgi:polar amino acid transport system substrate-binding protein